MFLIFHHLCSNNLNHCNLLGEVSANCCLTCFLCYQSCSLSFYTRGMKLRCWLWMEFRCWLWRFQHEELFPGWNMLSDCRQTSLVLTQGLLQLRTWLSTSAKVQTSQDVSCSVPTSTQAEAWIYYPLAQECRLLVTHNTGLVPDQLLNKPLQSVMLHQHLWCLNPATEQGQEQEKGLDRTRTRSTEDRAVAASELSSSVSCWQWRRWAGLRPDGVRYEERDVSRRGHGRWWRWVGEFHIFININLVKRFR